jgi:isocitrate lyase
VERINNSFRRADEIQWSKGTNPGDKEYTDYFAPSWPMLKPVSVAC